ncbi:MAG: hypothetical protein EXR11_07470 [Rhodospirillaceae bacterium]|nr:hypothetical protein [Rhodospirillaceae bacterium]
MKQGFFIEILVLRSSSPRRACGLESLAVDTPAPTAAAQSQLRALPVAPGAGLFIDGSDRETQSTQKRDESAFMARSRHGHDQYDGRLHALDCEPASHHHIGNLAAIDHLNPHFPDGSTN